MPLIQCRVPVKKLALEQTIIRANGNIERLGLVSYWHENRLCRWLFKLERFAVARRLRNYLES